jgi:hypothetical protein
VSSKGNSCKQPANQREERFTAWQRARHSRKRNGDRHITQSHVLGLELVLDVDVAGPITSRCGPAIDCNK